MTPTKYLSILLLILFVPILSGNIDVRNQPKAEWIDWEKVTCEQVADQSTRVASRFAKASLLLPMNSVAGRSYEISFSVYFTGDLGEQGAPLRFILADSFNRQQEIGVSNFSERFNIAEIIVTSSFMATSLIIESATADFIPEFLVGNLYQVLLEENSGDSKKVKPYPLRPLTTATEGQFTVPVGGSEMVLQDIVTASDQILLEIDLPLAVVGNGGIGSYRLRVIDKEKNSLVGSTSFVISDIGKWEISADMYRIPIYASLSPGRVYRVGVDSSGVRLDRRNRVVLAADNDSGGKAVRKKPSSEQNIGKNILLTLNTLERSSFEPGLIVPGTNHNVSAADAIPLGPATILTALTVSGGGQLSLGTDNEVIFLPAISNNAAEMVIPVESNLDGRQLNISLESPCNDTVPSLVEYSIGNGAWVEVEEKFSQGNAGQTNRSAAIIPVPAGEDKVTLRVGYKEGTTEFAGQEFIALRSLKVVIE